jgi:hypothetical protein
VRDARGGEGPCGEGAHAGLGIARDGLGEEAEQPARGAVGERAVPAHALAGAEKARAEDVLGAPARDRLEDALEAGGVVLAVAIEVNGGGVALVAGGLEARAKRRADATGDGMRDHPRAVLARDLRRGVTRAVVDYEHVDGEPASRGRQAANDGTDGSLLIARDNHRKRPAWWVHMTRRAGCFGQEKRAAARLLRRRQPEEMADRRRQLEYRARLV